MSAAKFNPEQVASWASQLRNESAASGAVTARLIQELEVLARKDQELNQRLVAALSKGLNARPIYLSCHSLLLERSRVFQELSVSTAQSAALCRQSVDTAEKVFGLSMKKRGDA